MSTNIYYVYAYLRKSNDSPYYIGKGCKNRAYDKRHNVSVPKDSTKIVFYHTSLEEQEALNLEIFYVSMFGRKDIGTGILLNRTNGGDGVFPSPITVKLRTEKMLRTRKQNGSYTTGIAKTMATRKKLGTLGAGKEGAKKAAATRKINGYKPSSESVLKTIATKRKNGIDITAQLNTPEARNKANIKCKLLSNRPEIKLLRILAKENNIKLGSGWVRKPDPWIQAKIYELYCRE